MEIKYINNDPLIGKKIQFNESEQIVSRLWNKTGTITQIKDCIYSEMPYNVSRLFEITLDEPLEHTPYWNTYCIQDEGTHFHFIDKSN